MSKKSKNPKTTKNMNLINNSKGITLIALVITIIVLLILAGVTINLTLGENGIFRTAEMAGKNYTQAQEQELAGIANFANEINNIISGTGTSGGSGTDTPEATEKLLKDIASPGDYVKYDTGTEKGVLTFRVLYNDDTYGLQIISEKNVENVILGGEDWTTARDSYNNAIATLNQKAERYATNSPYAIDGRCVGSIPTVGADGKFNAKNTENVGPAKLQFTTTVEGANNMKDKDTNSYVDIEAMNVAMNTSENAAGLKATGENYWLASRHVAYSSVYCHFDVRRVDTSGGSSGKELCNVYSGGSTEANTYEYGLRPCISLKSDIKVTAGDGKEATPYELGI